MSFLRNINQAVFISSSALSLGCSGLLFRDLTDFSQWVVKPRRSSVMWTYQHRHELVFGTLAGASVNLASSIFMPFGLPGTLFAGAQFFGSIGMLFVGYINPELMMRPRSHNAMYVTVCAAADILSPNQQVIVTKHGDRLPYTAFPETQLYRPHIAGIGKDGRGVPAAICYCALTGTGIVYETPDLPDGMPRKLGVLTQLENNLVLIDKATGHIGHQINGINETKLLEAMGETDYDKVGRHPPEEELKELGVEPLTEVASWKMPLKSFVRHYAPDGRVFINDYREFPKLSAPIKSFYDKMVDVIFDMAIHHHSVSPRPLFDTIEKYDERLPAKQRVWGFNVGDDYVAVTEDWVKSGQNGVRNMTVGGEPIVAAYDADLESLGIWKRPSPKPITRGVDVDGKLIGVRKGSKEAAVKLERLNTVKNGLFWFSWQNFFPQTRVNPEEK